MCLKWHVPKWVFFWTDYNKGNIKKMEIKCQDEKILFENKFYHLRKIIKPN